MNKSMFSYLIAGIITTLFLVLTQPCLAGTWRDDFEDDSTREWKVYDIALFWHDPNLKISKWQIDDNQVVGEIFGEGVASLWLTGEPTWRNYSISCRAKLVGGDNLPSIAFGLVLHARVDREVLHQHTFIVETLSNTARINKLMGEPFEDWSEKEFPFVVEVDTWYLLSATVHDSGKLTFRIKNLDPDFDGDEEVFTTTFAKPTEGGLAGLYVAGARAQFDDVEIKGSNIPNHGSRESFSVEPRGKLATTWGELKSK